MSLIKQLWIAITTLMALALLTSFTISAYSASSYYEEQLRLKNIDNANSLALMISQMDKDKVMIELLLAAQFDTGHYSRISLLDPLGKIYLEKRNLATSNNMGAPAWFSSLIDLKVLPGTAQIQDGWQQFGSLQVESDTRFAYESLWVTTQQFLFWFTVVSILLGAIGTLLLKMITRPLDDVVTQAEAIGGRRFITSQEPKTLEFGRVVRAMNTLSIRIRQMLETESRRLEEMRYKNQHDSLTGLANREYFLNLLDASLNDTEKSAKHGLILVRLSNLADINSTLGRQKTDKLIKDLAKSFDKVALVHKNQFSYNYFGRLNGRDLTLMFSHVIDFKAIADDLLSELNLLTSQYQGFNIQLPIAGCTFSPGENRGKLLMSLDNLLAQGELKNSTSSLTLAPKTERNEPIHGNEAWRELLTNALKEKAVDSTLFPVIGLDKKLLHQEAMMRLTLDGELKSAAYFIPWVKRLNMLPAFETAMVEKVLSHLSKKSSQDQIAINLSIETLKHSTSYLVLFSLLETYKHITNQIWFEFVEQNIFEDLDLLKTFSHRVKQYGCKVGLEQSGAKFDNIKDLQELGLDYLKLDAAFTQDLASQEANYNFVRGLTSLAHSIGLVVIATGIKQGDDYEALRETGIDAITGPGVYIS